MKYFLTDHAKARFRQRGISDNTLQYLEKYSKTTYAPGGALKFSLTRRNVNRIISALKKDIHSLERAGSIIIIQKEGKILTGYHKV